jgi:hypothetical protein
VNGELRWIIMKNDLGGIATGELGGMIVNSELGWIRPITKYDLEGTASGELGGMIVNGEQTLY